MEVKEIGKWTPQQDIEVFFDKVSKNYIIRLNSSIEVKPLYLSASFLINLEKNFQDIYQQKFLQLRVNVLWNLISILTERNEFVLDI